MLARAAQDRRTSSERAASQSPANTQRENHQLVRTVVMLLSSVLCVLLGLQGLVAGQDTREDGLCGPGYQAPSGREALCQHM